MKFRQYYVQGEQLYALHCSNCHQKNGQGLGRLYPPLNPSDVMEEHVNNVPCMIRDGISGAMVVNGETYNHPMPGIPTLTALEIAEIMTYIYNQWGRDKGIVDVTTVTHALLECPAGETQTN